MIRRIFNFLLLWACCSMLTAQPRSASVPKLLLQTAEGLMTPVWSPRGDKIAVTTDNYAGILVADADGQNLKHITHEAGAGYKMQWSADGTQLLGRTNVADQGRIAHEVKTWNVEGGEATVLMGKTRQLKGMPLWTASQHVTIADAEGYAVIDQHSSKSQPASTPSIYTKMVTDPAGVAAKEPALAQFAGKIIINPALSADGQQVAFQVPGRGIYICQADGSGLAFLCKGSHPTWLPDGSVLYTVVTDNGIHFTGSTLRAINPTSKATVTLLEDDDFVPLCPTATADGRRVAFENAKDASIYVVTLNY